MKKIFYISFLVILGGFSACTNNEDQPDPIPIPPPAPSVDAISDDLIGIWETYYFSKEIYMRANGLEYLYQGLRMIDYDGYKTEFYKDGNIYRFKSLNVINDVNDEGTYRVSKDTVYFTWKDKDNNDSITSQVIRRLDTSKGVLKTEDTYYGTIPNTGQVFKIIDFKAQRNIETAPTYSDVNPAKAVIDFDYLSTGEWDIIGCASWYGTEYDLGRTTTMEAKLLGSKYKFYTENGQKKCRITQWNPAEQKEESNEYDILIVDDVLYFFYRRTVGGPLESIYHWVFKFRTVNGQEQFIERAVNRYTDNLSILLVDEIYFAHRPD